MHNSQGEQTNHQFAATETKPTSPEEIDLWFAWGAIVVGAILVCFANTFGFEFVKEPLGNGLYRWNNSKLHEIAVTVRCVGAMLFFAGYMERLIFKFSASR